jgi:hypothetical protein
VTDDEAAYEPVLDPTIDDPDGTVTCTCGDVFTGANFAERMAAWQAHLDDFAGPPTPPDERGCYGWPRACAHHDDLACMEAESDG